MSAAAVEIHTVDAFTSEPFAGNPAAVCWLEDERSDRWLQAVAAEMNLSETAFLWRERDAFRLRWFTPAIEVPLCGHATLASAHVLYETGRSAGDAVRFATKSGELRAARSDGWIELDFPAFRTEAAALPAPVAVALGAAPRAAYLAGWQNPGGATWLIELESEGAVRGAQPDVRALPAAGATAVILTARADDRGFDFVSRFFAPGAGVDEDPVTGAAHCVLAPFWAERLGKRELTGFQASRRGGVVGVRVEGDRVALRGQAVTVLRGTLLR